MKTLALSSPGSGLVRRSAPRNAKHSRCRCNPDGRPLRAALEKQSRWMQPGAKCRVAITRCHKFHTRMAYRRRSLNIAQITS